MSSRVSIVHHLPPKFRTVRMKSRQKKTPKSSINSSTQTFIFVHFTGGDFIGSYNLNKKKSSTSRL